MLRVKCARTKGPRRHCWNACCPPISPGCPKPGAGSPRSTTSIFSRGWLPSSAAADGHRASSALLFGFPAATPSIPVAVRKEKTAAGEKWTRRFGEKSFVSHLSRREDDGPGVLRERFGPFSFKLRLGVEGNRVTWPVKSWRLLGIPMPRALMPKSETTESVGADGRFRFDVRISVPLAGDVVHYQRLAGAVARSRASAEPFEQRRRQIALGERRG